VFQLAEACFRELNEETGLNISLSDCMNQTVSTLALWEVSFHFASFQLQMYSFVPFYIKFT